jgi:hypothetical protein
MPWLMMLLGKLHLHIEILPCYWPNHHINKPLIVYAVERFASLPDGFQVVIWRRLPCLGARLLNEERFLLQKDYEPSLTYKKIKWVCSSLGVTISIQRRQA